MVEEEQFPKLRKLDNGVIERRPLNELENLGIDKKREIYAYYYQRKNLDPNVIEDHYRSMSYYKADGELTEEDCIWEYEFMTLIGEFFP